MARDRAEAVAYLNSLAMGNVYALVGRTTDDTVTGYKPVLDAAMRKIGIAASAFAQDDVVGAEDEEAFDALTQWLAYELILPLYALLVDQQVDQPLTNIKAGQMYLNLSKERERARAAVVALGYGPSSFAFVRWNTDWREEGAEAYLDRLAGVGG